MSLFADLGFERTTMRAVATRAGVDVALIYHHFGSKDGLLAAVLTVPEGVEPALRPLRAGIAEPGRAIVRAVLDLWESDPGLRDQAVAIIRTALSHEHAARVLQRMHSTTILALVADVVAEDNRPLRAALIGAHLSGLLLTRYVFRVGALTDIDPQALVDAAGPVIDHYLTGKITG